MRIFINRSAVYEWAKQVKPMGPCSVRWIVETGWYWTATLLVTERNVGLVNPHPWGGR